MGAHPKPAAAGVRLKLSGPTPGHPPRNTEHVSSTLQNAEAWILVGVTELLNGLSSRGPVTIGFLCEFWLDLRPWTKLTFGILVASLFGFIELALDS